MLYYIILYEVLYYITIRVTLFCYFLLVFFIIFSPVRQAEKLLQGILDAGMAPDVVTYTSLMVVLGNAGQYEKAVNLLDTMRAEVGEGGGGRRGKGSFKVELPWAEVYSRVSYQ